MKKGIFVLFATAILFSLLGCNNPGSQPQPVEDNSFKATYKVIISQDFLDVADIYVTYLNNAKNTIEEKMTSTTFIYNFTGTKEDKPGISIRYERKSVEYTKSRYEISYNYLVNSIYHGTQAPGGNNHSFNPKKEDMDEFFNNLKNDGWLPVYVITSIDNNGNIKVLEEVPDFTATYKVEVSQDFLEAADIYVSYLKNDKTTVETKLDSTTFTYNFTGKKEDKPGYTVRYVKKSEPYAKDSYNISYNLEFNPTYGLEAMSVYEHNDWQKAKTEMDSLFTGELSVLWPVKKYATINDKGKVKLTSE